MVLDCSCFVIRIKKLYNTTYNKCIKRVFNVSKYVRNGTFYGGLDLLTPSTILLNAKKIVCKVLVLAL